MAWYTKTETLHCDKCDTEWEEQLTCCNGMWDYDDVNAEVCPNCKGEGEKGVLELAADLKDAAAQGKQYRKDLAEYSNKVSDLFDSWRANSKHRDVPTNPATKRVVAVRSGEAVQFIEWSDK